MNAHKHRAKSLLHSNSSTKVWAVCRYWFGAGKHFPFLIVVTVIHIVAAKLNVSLLLCYENYCCEQQSVAIYCTLRSLCLSFTVFNFHFFSTLFCFGRLLCVCVPYVWRSPETESRFSWFSMICAIWLVLWSWYHFITFDLFIFFTNFVLWETNLCAHKCW